jgi:hypothetical protein
MNGALKKLVVAAVAAGALAIVGTAGASGGTIQLSGLQTPISADSYVMTGDLVGLWYQTSFELAGFQPSGTLQGHGTELYVGCIDSDLDGTCEPGEPAGTLDFAFDFSGKYDTVTFAEIHGRCHHEITGGTGDFAQATGVIDFKDDPVTGCATYKGHITF